MDILLYPSSAFVGGAPPESGSGGAGGSWRSLTVVSEAAPVVLKLSDDDAVLDEIDGTRNQVLLESVSIDGVEYPAGTTVNAAYDLINSNTGLRLTSVHLGGNGYETGAVHGLISTAALEDSTTYTFQVGRTSHNKGNLLADYVPCLVAGTLMRAPSGPRPVEEIASGDLVLTVDRGAQPVRHAWSQRVAGCGKAAPVVLPVGLFGNRRILRLSPEHRVMMSGAWAEAVCGRRDEVLVAAKFLCGWWGIAREDCPLVRYVHLLMDEHELLWAEDMAVESYLWTVKRSQPLGAPRAEELSGQFPDGRLETSWTPVRPVIRRRDLRRGAAGAAPTLKAG